MSDQNAKPNDAEGRLEADHGLETLDRLDELLSCYFDDCLDEEAVAELNELLAKDPEARKRWVDNSMLNADLYDYFRPADQESRQAVG